MTSVPASERKQIAFIGLRNAGKSSLINAFGLQEISIVSEIPGTTTDPVRKAMELLPFGPVVLVDTAGYDDDSVLGAKRMNRTHKAIASADFIVVVIDASVGLSEIDESYISYVKSLNVPFIVAINKSDLGLQAGLEEHLQEQKFPFRIMSALKPETVTRFRDDMSSLMPAEAETPLISDLISPGDTVVLVMPIDAGAPKGRIILPQVQVLREVLDASAVAVVLQDADLKEGLRKLVSPPKIIVTDSQAIKRVAADSPAESMLTTFSILMARHKGDLKILVRGLKAVDNLKDGDKVLIAESCTHHAQEDDIGRIKIPRWLKEFCPGKIDLSYVKGQDFPDNLSEYKLIIHCGGCMLTGKTMMRRLNQAEYFKVPIVNYGMLISYMHGAIPRALEPFPAVIKERESAGLSKAVKV